MDKAVFLGGFVSAGFLIAGTYLFPTSLLMWFASTSGYYVAVRTLLMVLLLAILCTTPPRKIRLRLLMGAAALGCAGWSVGLAATGSMHILDMLVFMEVGIAMGLEALEFTAEELYERARRLHTPQLAEEVSHSFHLRTALEGIQQLVRQARTDDHAALFEFRLPT